MKSIELNNTKQMKPKKSDNAKPEKPNKPKRPLSGYNLFYRYKRNAVLNHTQSQRSPLSEADEKTTISNILTALPGLENTSPSHILWSLPPSTVNELRASNIRKAMEGKLFPNENARNRLHRKVHGMGFVEMGKVMRDMWASIDNVTKDVFCELADVGRVRYRALLAEFKRQENGVEVRPPTMKAPVPMVASSTVASAPAAAAASSNHKVKQGQESEGVPNSEMATGGRRKASTSSSFYCSVTPKTEPKPNALGFVSPVLATDGGKPQIAWKATSSPSNNGNTNSNSSDNHEPMDLNSLEPFAVSNNVPTSSQGPSLLMGNINMTVISVPTNTEPNTTRHHYGRRVSTDMSVGSVNSVNTYNVDSAASTPMMCCTPVNNQATMEIEYMIKNSIFPPPPLFRGPQVQGVSNANTFRPEHPAHQVSTNDNAGSMISRLVNSVQSRGMSSIGETSYMDIITSNSSSAKKEHEHCQTSMPQKAPPDLISLWKSLSTSLSSTEYSNYSNPAPTMSSSNSQGDHQDELTTVPSQEVVSTSDFLQLIGTLDEAIDHHTATHNNHSKMITDVDNLVFGQPVHDVQMMNIQPLPASYELNNARARMA